MFRCRLHLLHLLNNLCYKCPLQISKHFSFASDGQSP
nr:MAG TPA: hypothetical protein [Caudoviricetes sp.]